MGPLGPLSRVLSPKGVGRAEGIGDRAGLEAYLAERSTGGKMLKGGRGAAQEPVVLSYLPRGGS